MRHRSRREHLERLRSMRLLPPRMLPALCHLVSPMLASQGWPAKDGVEPTQNQSRQTVQKLSLQAE